MVTLFLVPSGFEAGDNGGTDETDESEEESIGEGSGVTLTEEVVTLDCIIACLARMSLMRLLFCSSTAIVFSTPLMKSFLRSRVILACIRFLSRLKVIKRILLFF